MTIAVAVSGGADSFYALAHLHEQGERVVALHGLFQPTAKAHNDVINGLQTFCQARDIPFHVLDMREEFQKNVIAPFVQAYQKGRTPNPCAVCNATIKFGLFAEKALNLGAERFATGHYAATVQHPRYGFALQQGMDTGKDQSYFLALVARQQLTKALFPLAGVTKTAIRAWLLERGYAVPAPNESQEICFVPNDDYRAFLQAQHIALPPSGPIVLQTPEGVRVLGQHEGLWQYTEGQRRGLGVSWSEPLYVLAKDCAKNALIVGTKHAALGTTQTADQVNILVDYALWPLQCFVRVRYRQRPEPARVHFDGHRLIVTFENPTMPGAPGQVLAISDEDGYILAGGVLTCAGG